VGLPVEVGNREFAHRFDARIVHILDLLPPLATGGDGGERENGEEEEEEQDLRSHCRCFSMLFLFFPFDLLVFIGLFWGSNMKKKSKDSLIGNCLPRLLSFMFCQSLQPYISS